MAPCTGKIIKNGLDVFDRENLLQNVYYTLYLSLSQLSEIVLQT